MGSQKHLGGSGLARPTAEGAGGQLQGILNRQDALVPSNPSFVVLLGSVNGSVEQRQVATIVPGILGMRRSDRELQLG